MGTVTECDGSLIADTFSGFRRRPSAAAATGGVFACAARREAPESLWEYAHPML